MNDRQATINVIRASLRARSGKTWSVTGGTGTAWGWITISSPPKRRNEFGCMTPEDRKELAELLGLDEVHAQGVSVPSQTDFRQEYMDRAQGKTPAVVGVAQWD